MVDKIKNKEKPQIINNIDTILRVMNALKIVPNDALYDMRSLHQIVNMKRDFNLWCKDKLKKYNLKCGVDYTKRKNNMRIEYMIKVDYAIAILEDYAVRYKKRSIM